MAEPFAGTRGGRAKAGSGGWEMHTRAGRVEAGSEASPLPLPPQQKERRELARAAQRAEKEADTIKRAEKGGGAFSV